MARIVTEPTGQSSARAWIGDFVNGDREHLIPGGAKLDAAQFAGARAVRATTTAPAVAGATTVAVAALTGPIPSGTVLDFGGAKFARTTAPAVAGATSVVVAALPTALVAGDSATYLPVGAFKTVQSGTVLGRTIAERDANTPYGPAADADDEVRILVFDVTDANVNNDVTIYRPGALVKDNFLPGFAALSAAVQAKLRSTYVCTKGAF